MVHPIRQAFVAKGQPKAAQKLGEEAVETVIAAVSGDRAGVVSESADLLYHLAVVWNIAGVALEDVLQELQRRTAQTGLAERPAARRAERQIVHVGKSRSAHPVPVFALPLLFGAGMGSLPGRYTAHPHL